MKRAHALALVVLPLATVAAAPAPPGRAPDAILQDYAAALGGQKAWMRHRSVRIKRQVEVRGMQIQGTEERHATAAGKVLSVTTIPGMGTFRQGSTGRVRWAEDPINGLRVLAGPEDETARIDSTWSADFQLKKLYKEVRAAPPPAEAPAGAGYECLELIPRLARPAITCFDGKTHLRVLQKGVHATPQGDVPYTAQFRDWRAVDGVKVPFEEQMTAGPMTLEARILEIEFDAKVDPKLFEMPDVAAGGAAPAPAKKK